LDFLQAPCLWAAAAQVAAAVAAAVLARQGLMWAAVAVAVPEATAHPVVVAAGTIMIGAPAPTPVALVVSRECADRLDQITAGAALVHQDLM